MVLLSIFSDDSIYLLTCFDFSFKFMFAWYFWDNDSELMNSQIFLFYVSNCKLDVFLMLFFWIYPTFMNLIYALLIHTRSNIFHICFFNLVFKVLFHVIKIGFGSRTIQELSTSFDWQNYFLEEVSSMASSEFNMEF